jgi:ankyrin repeat protein
VKKLLDDKFDPNSATKSGTTALMLAMPDAAKAKLLLAAGANVNARSKTRYSALLVAAQYPDSTSATQLLLDKGAEVQLPKGAGRPLFNAIGLSLATMSGNVEAIRLYASRGDRFDDPFVALGVFPGPAAGTPVFSGDTRAIAALLDAGMAVDMAGPDGMTLLGMAVLANRIDAAKLLISRGADTIASTVTD